VLLVLNYLTITTPISRLIQHRNGKIKDKKIYTVKAFVTTTIRRRDRNSKLKVYKLMVWVFVVFF